jgi:hypothetical protein
VAIERSTSEIYQFYAVVAINQNIFWLQIAMNEVGSLKSGECLQNLSGILPDLI